MGTIDEIQTHFSEIFQQVIQVKTNILELQQKETESLKEEIREFSKRVKHFREEFKKNAPFSFEPGFKMKNVKEAFKTLKAYEENVEEIKKESIKYNDLENLFELEKTKYKSLRECQADIKKLNRMWGHILTILTQYEKWQKVLWKNIKVDEISPENEKFVILLKQQPREIKNLRAYPTIVERVQNMKKTLNCIDMLSSEAMQPRHWEGISLDIGQ